MNLNSYMLKIFHLYLRKKKNIENSRRLKHVHFADRHCAEALCWRAVTYLRTAYRLDNISLIIFSAPCLLVT